MKFEVGEIAILVKHSPPGSWASKYGDVYGSEVEILSLPGQAICPHCDTKKKGAHHYGILMPDGKCFCVLEEHMRKRPQPGIPESILRIFEVELKQGKPA